MQQKQESLGTREKIILRSQISSLIGSDFPPKTRETTTKYIDETIRLMNIYVAELIFPNVFGCEEESPEMEMMVTVEIAFD